VRRPIHIIFLALLTAVLVDCKKDHSILGTDVQPTADELNASYITGLPVIAHTIPYDSIASYSDQYKYIGSNEDPYFGRMDLGLYFNANMNVTNLDFGVNSVLSSAEFIFAVDNLQFAGDVSATLNYSVYPLDSTLDVSRVYYTSNNRLHNKTGLISVFKGGSFSQMPETGQTVIRITLDSLYATTLLHDSPNLTSNDVFQAKYRGFYITTDIGSGTEGIIYKANLDDPVSGLYLHYKASSATTDTIINFQFTFTGSSAVKYNTVKFAPKQVIKDQFQDSTLGGTDLYLKGMGMTKLKVQIPFLQNYSDSFKIAVNRAEIIFNVDPAFVSSGLYTPPPELTLLAMDTLSREVYLTDQLNATDHVRYDGTYDQTNNRYVFNIAREAQLIFRGQKKNRGFYLVVANTNISLYTVYAGTSKELLPLRRDNYIERVILAGFNNTLLKPKFNLNYIKFKNE
jgi:hypothetical protein